MNLDPIAENFNYAVAIDIRELISLEDVMEELNQGPNGGLIYCIEHLEENLEDCLTEQLKDYLDDDSSSKSSSILIHECKWNFI